MDTTKLVALGLTPWHIELLDVLQQMDSGRGVQTRTLVIALGLSGEKQAEYLGCTYRYLAYQGYCRNVSNGSRARWRLAPLADQLKEAGLLP